MFKKSIFLGVGIAAVLGFALTLSGCGGDEPYSGLDYDKYIKLGQYKGLTVEAPGEVKVSDKEVQERIDQTLESSATSEKLGKDDEIKKGDTVNIDYSGIIDGKEFEGGTAKGQDLEIGSGSFIDGFEDGLVGKKIGDKVSLDLTFPKDYQGEEVAGKDVTFKVTINSATRPNKPEYTEEYVKENTDFETKAEYEASVKKTIKKEKEEAAVNEQKTTLWSQVLDKTEVIEYPKEELEHYEEVFDAQVDTMAKDYGAERSEIIAQYFGASDEKAFKKMIRESAQTLIKQELIVEDIAEKEGIEYTDKEKEAKIAELEQQGYDEESVQSYTGRTLDQYVDITILYEKVMDFILEKAEIKKAK